MLVQTVNTVLPLLPKGLHERPIGHDMVPSDETAVTRTAARQLPTASSHVTTGFVRTPTHYVVPRPHMHDHWEIVASGHPFLQLTADEEEPRIALRYEGPMGLARARQLIAPHNADRLERLLRASARLGPEFMSSVVAVRAKPGRRLTERIVADRCIVAASLGPRVLAALIDTASEPPRRTVRAQEATGLELAAGPLPPLEDHAALRRTVRRVTDLFAPVWDVPVPQGPPPRKRELDARLSRLYTVSLRLLGTGLDDATVAKLRVEARDLHAGYLRASVKRPGLLDTVLDRLDVR